MNLYFEVEGNPIPKQSYRHKKGGGYQPQRVVDWQKKVGWAAREAMQGTDLTYDWLHVHLEFYRGDKRKVDLDNLSKAVLDACNKIVWNDDKQICFLTLRKRYDKERPRLHVHVNGYEPGLATYLDNCEDTTEDYIQRFEDTTEA